MVTLFTVHMTRENEFHVATAFVYLLDTLKEFNKEFKPHAFVRDGATCILNAIGRVFGADMNQVSDSFHFKENALQMLSSDIGSNKDKVRFLKFMHDLQHASDRAVFETIHKMLLAWINEKESRKNKVSPYLDYWMDRRVYWSQAFINSEAETHSVAEAGNSMMARKGINKNSAIDKCLKWECCVYIKHYQKVESLKTGNHIPRGKTRAYIDKEKMEAIYERVAKNPVDEKEFVSIVDEIARSLHLSEAVKESGEVAHASASFIDTNLEEVLVSKPKSADFRYREKKMDIVSKKPGRPKGSKIRKPSAYDEIGSWDSDEEVIPKKKKGKWEKLPTNWCPMHEKVTNMTSYDVVFIDQLKFRVMDKAVADYEDRLVIFREEDQKTSCTCEDFQKKNLPCRGKGKAPTTMNCKHIEN